MGRILVAIGLTNFRMCRVRAMFLGESSTIPHYVFNVDM